MRKGPTLVQRYASPVATWAYSTMRYVDRRALATGINMVLKHADETDRAILKYLIGAYGVALPRARDLTHREFAHFDFRRDLTPRKLMALSEAFYEATGRRSLRDLQGGIVKRQTEGLTITRDIDHLKVLGGIKPSIFRTLRTKGVEVKQSAKGAILDAAYDLALRQKGATVDYRTLVYRVRKMAEIGGGLNAMVASLFMDRQAQTTPPILGESNNEKLRALAWTVYDLIFGFQYLRDHFEFDVTRLERDSEYLYKQTQGLVSQAASPEVLLLFFLFVLNQARREKTGSHLVDPIRFLHAPLAERLGLVTLADDFRDQLLRIENQADYDFIVDKVRERIGLSYEEAKIFLGIYVENLFALLRKRFGLGAQEFAIIFRVKSPYSVWHKVDRRRDYDFRTINDILGITIVCESDKMLGDLQKFMRKNPLFTTRSSTVSLVGNDDRWRGIRLDGLYSQDGTPLEIQIVTHEMYVENERGLASHWGYNLGLEIKAYNKKRKLAGAPIILPQVFYCLELPEVMGVNFVENFTQLVEHGAKPMEQLRDWLAAGFPVNDMVFGA